MKYDQKIKAYQPFNLQEYQDQQIILQSLSLPNILTRQNTLCHFCVSAWIVNQDYQKVLMGFHRIYQSYSWLGGHVDGDDDFLAVILKEVREESGIKEITVLKDDIFSLEVLTVNGHIKDGLYVSSHLHFNITFLLQIDDHCIINENKEEMAGMKWIKIEDIASKVNEPWMYDHVYQKLITKTKKFLTSSQV